MTCEQGILAGQRLGADAVLDEVVVGLDAPVVSKDGQAAPVLGDIG